MNLGISKQLKYDIQLNTDRAAYVNSLFDAPTTTLAYLHFTEPSTQQELETIANYILYGKGEKSGKNYCQKHEIQIKAAHASYQKKEPESLEGLLEEELTAELMVNELGALPKFKKEKPTIDREKDKDIPGMADLWVAIDRLSKQVQQLKINGELGLEFYRKNHLLIELRKEQFTLKDIFKKEVLTMGYHCPGPVAANLSDDTGYVIDYKEQVEYAKFRKEHYTYSKYEQALAEIAIRKAQAKLNAGIEWDWVDVSANTIDLTNAGHVYAVLENYSLLKENSYENLDSDCKYLLWELEDLVERSKLSPARFAILIGKVDKLTNAQIAEHLQQQFHLYYSDNYISTIFVKMICEKIARTAQLKLDEFMFRDHEEMFKVCSRCGRKLLRDPRNFVRKANSSDGLTARCKDCDKEVRQLKSGIKGDRI